MELEKSKEYLKKFNDLILSWSLKEKCELNKAIETVLQALENSIPKEKVEKGIDRIEDYFDRLNGPDEDIDFIKEVKQELLEE